MTPPAIAGDWYRGGMHRFAPLVFACLMAACSTEPPAVEPTPRTAQPTLAWDALGIDDFQPTAAQRRYDVARYAFALAIDPVTCRVTGRATIEGSKADALDFIELDLHDSIDVERARAGGAETPVTRTGRDKIRVAVAPGPRFAVEVDFAGRPSRVQSDSGWIGGLRFDRVREHPVINTCFQPFFARFLWPCKDHPSDKAERGVSLAITVPDAFTVVATGHRERIERLAGGQRAHHWSTTNAVATNVIAFAAAPYVEIRDTFPSAGGATVRLSHWVLPDSEADARIAFAEVPRVLSIYEARFGPYPFARDKFSLVETSYQPLENQTAIAYGSVFPTGRPVGTYDYPLVHEAAHEWFGNSVTCTDWRDVWLHEGLATFAESLYLEARDGAAHATALARAWHERASDDALVDRDVQSDDDIFRSAVVYARAAAVVRMLRWVVGDDAFFAALADFHATHAGGNATTADFRRVVERHARRDLRAFFDAWVRGTGRVAIDWRAIRVPGGIEVRLQTTSGHRLPVDVRLADDVRRRVDIGPSPIRVRLAWPADEPWSCRLDADAWLLLATDQRREIRGD